MLRKSEHLLMWLMVTAIVAGFLSSYIWGEAMVSVSWIGDFFLTALKMLIVPLVVASVVTGVAGLGDVRKLGRLGGISVGYYAITHGSNRRNVTRGFTQHIFRFQSDSKNTVFVAISCADRND